MATNTSLTSAAEAYFSALRQVRASGGATAELSNYVPLANLLDAVGATLKPKVFCVSQLADQGADHPDYGLYAATQIQKGRPRQGQLPERGVIEMKPLDDDAWLTTDAEQVSKYWGLYRLVLVTNLRDFVLLGEDERGRPAKLETFRLAGSAEEFEERLAKPRALARESGAALGEYLRRALAHRATLAEPRDLAWLLASYARDGLARVEAAPATPPRWPPCAPPWRRRWACASRASGAPPSSDRPWCRRSSTASSPPGCCGRGPRRRQPAGSTGMKRSGTCGRRCCGRSSSRSRTPAACSRWGWSRCWTGRRRRSTAWTGAPSSPSSTRARPCPTSTSPSWRPSTRPCASSSGSGTPRPRWCATWSPAWTGR